MNKWALVIIVILSFSCKKIPNEKLKKEENSISTKPNKDSLEMNIIDEKKTEVSPEVLFIMSFYKNYMFEYDKDEYNPKEIETILNEYCSENFLNIYSSYEYLDYNPFINGQDYPDDFLKNLKVESSDKKLENRFIIYQTYNAVDYELLQMEIIKKEENFKINKLYTPDGSEMLSMQKDSTSKNVSCDFPDDFHRFQKSIIDGNINESGEYLDFPFKSENIWHLVFLNSSEEESYNPKIDFTLKDFRNHFDDLFPYGFKELLKEINANMLLKSSKFSSETKSSKDAEGNINETYSLVTSYSEHDGKLMFSLFIEFHEDEEIYETQIVYDFEYTNCKIKLKNIHLAG